MTDRHHSNLFQNLPSDLPEELVETLAENRHVHIERIVSTGQASLQGFWYDQAESEWVVVLEGEAQLLFEGDDEPRMLPAGCSVPDGEQPLGVCRSWQALTGDAGWAGVVAEAFWENPHRLVYLPFSPGRNLLPLIAEALSLLPPAKRWQVTFSTYFADLPRNVTRNWRCVLNDSRLPTSCLLPAACG